MEHKEEVLLREEKIVITGKQNNLRFEFPIIWLRDNCQCSECFHTQTFTRTIDWNTFNFNVKLKKFEVRVQNLVEHKNDFKIIIVTDY